MRALASRGVLLQGRLLVPLGAVMKPSSLGVQPRDGDDLEHMKAHAEPCARARGRGAGRIVVKKPESGWKACEACPHPGGCKNIMRCVEGRER